MYEDGTGNLSVQNCAIGDLKSADDLRHTLTSVADAEDYIEVDDGSAAIAAAELVAAARDGKIDCLSDDARTWLGHQAERLTESDRDLAARAVHRVLGADSELAELWDEGGHDSEWRRDVNGLVARLAGR